MIKIKKIFSFLFFCLFFFVLEPVFAADQSVVTPIFPVRGREYWRQGSDLTYLTDLIDLVNASQVQATWLIQYDALLDQQIVSALQRLDPQQHEIGLFIEVTRKLDDASFVYYDWQYGHWSSANKVFLSGYTRQERQRLIDQSFSRFQETFGYSPQSYGAWYVDVYSLEYIKDHYGLDAVLGLADQYSTDGYQTWGQYLNQPYYVSKKSALEPALSQSDNTGVVKVLWAPREPTLSYGSTGENSNYSVQVNDYHRYHGLGLDYFSQLLDDSCLSVSAPLSQLVVGIEVAELEGEYLPQLQSQLDYLYQQQSAGRLSTLSLSQFSSLYHQTYPQLSPALFLTSSQGDLSSYWYFSPVYRLGLFLDQGYLSIRDLRQYHQNGLRDNDQIFKDLNHNLNRLVSAIIDDISLSNQVVLGQVEAPVISQVGEQVTLSFSQGQITLSPDHISVQGFPQPSFAQPADTGWQVTFSPQEISSLSGLCSNEYGRYLNHSCLTYIPVWLSQLSPDLRYSRLDGQVYLGLKTGPETFWGLRFPQLKVGRFHFDYPILENFVLINKLKEFNPDWFGKQEQEVADFSGQGQVKKKFAAYGWQPLLEDIPQDIIFENSYYVITHD